MPAGFRRHLVGKTRRNVSCSVVTQIRFFGRLMIMKWLSHDLRTTLQIKYTDRKALGKLMETSWKIRDFCRICRIGLSQMCFDVIHGM